VWCCTVSVVLPDPNFVNNQKLSATTIFKLFQNYGSGNIDFIAYNAISKDCSLNLN
jgi:hypothetical protein